MKPKFILLVSSWWPHKYRPKLAQFRPIFNFFSFSCLDLTWLVWSATQGLALWALLNVTWRQMFHGHWWMKCYPSTPYGHYWMLWLGDRRSMVFDEWSTTPSLDLWPLLNVVPWRQMFHGHRWMKCYTRTSPMTITECCDRCSMGINKWSTTQGPVLWPLLNVVTWLQMFHGHRWMKYYPGTSPMAITECCDLEWEVPWA
jgi:hypothetical protein